MSRAYTIPLLVLSLLTISVAHHPGHLHAQGSTSALFDGRAVAISGGKTVWNNPAGDRFSGSMLSVHWRDYRPDHLGFEIGGLLLPDRAGTNLQIDAGGTVTFPIGEGAALIRGGGFTGLFSTGGIGLGAYAGAGGLYLVDQNFGITADLTGRQILASNLIWTFGVGVVFGID